MTAFEALLLRELGYGEVERSFDPDWNAQLASFDKLGPLVARYPLADRRSDVMAARAMLRERLGRID
jgi:DNA repair protein RecO (recombination protein O)